MGGSLLIGLMARYGWEKIRRHGIPEAIEAILLGSARLDLRVAILKPISSAISIGTGGPFGAEGPIIMTGGSASSLMAQRFSLTDAERKTLVVAGACAGMTAATGVPKRAVMSAIKFLLFELKPRSVIPVLTASIASMAVTLLLMKRSILTEKIARRGHHLTREYSINPLAVTRAREIMTTSVETLSPSMTVGATIKYFLSPETRHCAFPIVDAEQPP